MPVTTEQVLIEFIPDTSQLEAAEARLLALGKIDEKSGIIFKATNDQLKARQGITETITAATTKEQLVVNKLVDSLKSLSGESKTAVQSLLKLSANEITAGFQKAGVTVDKFISTLAKAGSGANLKATTDQIKAQDLLFGKLTLSVTKEQVAVNKLVTSLKTLSGEGKAAVQSLLKLSTNEITAGLDEMGLSAEEYVESLNKAGGATDNVEKSSIRLKAQLRGMIEELARLKLAGQENTEQYRSLAQSAGNLSDTIGDVSSEVKRLGSDTGVFDGLIGGVQGLAGGFAVAQGAQALFGDSSEELQETLVKVGAAMAVLQGLQQVQNTLQAESSVSLLVVNLQQKIQNAQIVIENGLQSRSIVVRTGAAVAQRALNAAMAANPIGIVITALVTVIGLFALYANGAKKAAEQQAALNGALKSAGDQLDADVEGIKRANTKRISELETAGAKQSDILRANAQSEVLIQKKKQEEIEKLDKIISQNRDVSDEKTLEDLEKLKARRETLSNETADSIIDTEIKNREGRKQVLLEGLEDAVSIRQAEIDKISSLGGKNTGKEFAARKELAKAEAALEISNAGENSAKILAIRKQLDSKLHQLDVEAREQAHKETLAALETELVDRQNQSRAINERQSQDEIDTQKKIVLATARFEAEQEGLTEKQRTAIRAKGLQDASALQNEFDKKSIQDSLADYISLNEAQLTQVGISEKEKLDLRIENIIAAAAIEEEQNKGVSARVKEINAKRDADIKAARLQSIQDTLAFELRVFETGFAAENRGIEKQLAAQDQLRSAPNAREKRRLEETLGIRKLSIAEENALIDKQTQHSLQSIDKEKDALRDSFRQKLIPLNEYNQEYAELNDEQVKIVDDAEGRKRAAATKTMEIQKALNIELASQLIDIGGQVGNLIYDSFQVSLDKQTQKISEQRQKINDLRESGAISEKEAIKRLRETDMEERKIKQAQAMKDKQAAIFNAAISTAQAVIKAYATVGPIAGPVMAAIAGAIGAAQIALIAARPIPKFAKGKKDRYEGLGQVGEAGTELIESNGHMYVTKKPTIVWLGKSDKVYNPKETRAILNREMPGVNNAAIMQLPDKGKAEKIDYDKLGQAIGKYTSNSLQIDGFKDFIQREQTLITYLHNRRKF